MHAFLRSACSCVVQAVRVGFSTFVPGGAAAAAAALWDEEALVLECISPQVSAHKTPMTFVR